MVRQTNFKKLKKEIHITRSHDRPRPLLFENYNQRCPPLPKSVAQVSLYQNFDPTKCLRNQPGMVSVSTVCRCNRCSLTDASPPLTKIFVRRKTLNEISFHQFLQEDYQ